MGAVDFLALRNQGITGQRHVVFPTDKGANTANSRVEHHQSAPISPSPDHALLECRHDLAPLAQKRSVRIEYELGIIKTAAFPFIDAKNHHSTRFPCRVAYGFSHGARNIDGLFMEPDEQVRNEDRRIYPGKIGIIRNERLRKHGKSYVLLPALFYGFHHLIRCSVPIEKAW